MNNEWTVEERREIQVALATGSLTEDEREEIVAEALERADKAPPRGRLRALLFASAAMLLTGIGIWSASRDPNRREDAPTLAGDVEKMTAEQRTANERFLATDSVQAKLSTVEPGTWIVVAGGKRILTGTDLESLIAKMTRATGNDRCYHRFVFRKNDAGHRSYKITFGDAPWAGTGFLAAAQLSIGTLYGHGMGFSRGKRELTIRKSPDGRPWLPLNLAPPGGNAGATHHVVVSTGSAGPLLLPVGTLSSLAEIPGTATLEAIGGVVNELRRHIVRVRVPELWLDEYVEAVAVPGIGDRRTAGKVWRYIRSGLVDARAKALKKRVAVISGHWFPGLENKLENCEPLLQQYACFFEPIRELPLKEDEARIGRGHAWLFLFSEQGEMRVKLVISDKTPAADLVKAIVAADPR